MSWACPLSAHGHGSVKPIFQGPSGFIFILFKLYDNMTIIRNFRACIKASEIIPSDIPHVSKINWTCKDHEGDHREKERILKQYAWSTKECWS